MRTRVVSILMILLMVVVVGCGNQQSAKDEKIKVGVIQIVEHPALDSARQGFKDLLAEEGYKEGEDIVYDYQNAQGDMSTAQTIAKTFSQKDFDLILAIATPTSQAVANTIKDTPILITAVTDPKSAGLVDDMEHPGGNLTGTSDLTPVKKQLELFNKLEQKIKKVGILYNSGETNSVFLKDLAKEKAQELGLEMVEAPVTSSSEVYQTAQSLVGRVDGIYVPTDNTIVSAIQSVIKVTNKNDLPLIVADNSSVKEGALATLGIDYYKLGQQTGQMAVKVLNGTDPGELPIQRIQDADLIINQKAAKEMNVEIPQKLIDEAKKVIK
ncbi:ABC transporter substrate-binding protein [Halanaerobacter jeridensis]|uniref:ABC transport system substrate-binding protein n=1 Tax=Halanaerobacter jeridensis TaxID=706427 RepID=A0A938XUH3_9FIRM|nr:ABC transporter substrate-binding protein [Halanaerobacter jeridensis]MBM7555480.1 putative ABC transport system substrate-binding protein [Halanaerobacter jeridensis]